MNVQSVFSSRKNTSRALLVVLGVTIPGVLAILLFFTRAWEQQSAAENTPTVHTNAQGEETRPAGISFRDFCLGMTRKEVHELFEQWGVQHATLETGGRNVDAWTELPKDRYKGIQACAVGFDDGYSAIVYRTKRAGERLLVPSRELHPDAAAARLFVLTFEFEEQQGSPQPIIAACKERFGKPLDHEPEKQGPWLEPIIGFKTFNSSESFSWMFPEGSAAHLDLSTYLKANTKSFRAVLTLMDGAAARIAAARFLQAEQKYREDQKVQGAANTILSSRAAHAPRDPIRDFDGQDSPKELLGTWRVLAQGLSNNGYQWHWEGILTLRQETAGQGVRGNLEWFEGEALGTEELNGGLYKVKQSSGEETRLLVLRTVRTLPIIGSLANRTYVASPTADGLKIAFGECEEVGKFQWRALRLEDDASGEYQPLGRKWSGVHENNQDLTLEIRTEEFVHGYARLQGHYGWPNLRQSVPQGQVTPLTGMYHAPTGRMWFYVGTTENGHDLQALLRDRNLSEQPGILLDGYLDKDGVRLSGECHGRSWRIAERDTEGTWTATWQGEGSR